MATSGAASKTSCDDEGVEALKIRIAQLEKQLAHATSALGGEGARDGKDAATSGAAGGDGGGPPSSSLTSNVALLSKKSSFLTTTTGKSGYLFKWQDRSIGWGGTKWGLRFVSLDRGRLSYYRNHTDLAPRYVLTLKRCAVRDDGFKRNNKHKSKDKEPSINEVGAYFHVFSIYQRPDVSGDGDGPASLNAEDDDESKISPLLRFSTPSLAEQQQWIERISEACAFADSDDFLLADKDGESTNIGTPATPTMPVAKPGTLPPLIFGAPAFPKPRRTPSGMKLSPMGSKKKSYTKVSSASDSAKSNKRQVSAYPPSKPMHRAAEPSFLSDEASSQNYRGLLNLALIVLVVSNFRLILDTVRKHGFVLSNMKKGIDLEAWRHAPLTVSPFLTGVALLFGFTFMAYCIEFTLSRKYVNEWFGMALHVVNSNASLFIPSWICWKFIDRPAVGAILLIHATITWMKLISYAHANSDYRTAPETHMATIALLKDLDVEPHEISYPMYVTVTVARVQLDFFFQKDKLLTFSFILPFTTATS